MGVAISTHTSLAPISLASTIIGFVSFVFTIGTATRVFWGELSTWSAAPHEMEDHLTNLKQSLFEERFHMKRARRIHRRRSRSVPAHGERGGEKGATSRDREFVEEERVAALRAMSIALKHMIRNFRELERPFLKYPNDDRGRRKSARGDDAWYSDEEWRDDMTNVYFHPEYKECGLRERLAWLKNKSRLTSLSESLTRLTIRRIGIQTTYVSTYVIGYCHSYLLTSIYQVIPRTWQRYQ
jgi:hypothetical protein